MQLIIKSTMTVGELKELLENKYDILTPSGNIAGDSRKLRALTEKDISKGVELELDFDSNMSDKFHAITGIKVSLKERNKTIQPAHEKIENLTLPKLTPSEKQQFENGVIQVNGKAMNRTALGIIDAFLTLYPQTTFQELKEAFPDSINPSGPRAPKTIFKPFTDRDFGVVHSLDEIKKEFSLAGLPYESLFFLEKNERFKTSDGKTIVVNKLWESQDTETGENDLENLAKAASEFGIVVNKFEARKSFTKGSYSLDILKPDLFKKISNNTEIIEKEVVVEKEVVKKIIPFWIWIVLGLAAIPILLWAFGVFKGDPVLIEKETIVEKEVIKVVVDTVYMQQIADIETNFNSVQFAQGQSDLPEAAKFALYDLAKVMETNKDFKIRIEGHSSDEGDPSYNLKLSDDRAKAVVDFLISRGVDAERLTYKGMGSSNPIDLNNSEANRRTEFIIIEE